MDLREVHKRNELIVQNRHPWEIARVKVIKDLLKKNSSLHNGKTILDIGCGDTFVVEELANFLTNSTFLAIDTAFNDELIATFNNKINTNNIRLFKTLNDAIPFIQNEVSLVTLLDVVEHVENDVDFLRSITNENYITSNTEILITVPAFQSLFCSHDTFLGHFRRYTNISLEKSIVLAGLKITDKGYFFMLLLCPRLLNVLKEKINPNNTHTTGLVEWMGGNLITKLISSLLYFDYKLGRGFKKLGLNVIGLSNYAICKKIV